MRKLILASLVLFAMPLFAASPLEGSWKGVITLAEPFSSVGVSLTIEPDGNALQGRLSLFGGIVRNEPLSMIALDGQRVTLMVKGVPGNPTLNGTLAGDKLFGDFLMSGRSWQFRLIREE